MVNNAESTGTNGLRTVTRLVALYVAVVLATIITLGILSVAAPGQATNEAWGHAVIVAVFAVLLPLRLRAARRGNARARRAIGIIAIVLAVVNVVEALLPDLFPAWMRIEMFAIAAMMAAIAALSLRKAPTPPEAR